ncbi:hypothetical protein R6Q59_007242 [Mikania micrantha]
MSILVGKSLVWLCFVSLLSIKTTITFAQPNFLTNVCGQNENYTANSTYRRNLDTALSILPTTNTGLGFFNHSTGQGINTVNSVALCRGDVEPNLCRSCLNDSIVKLREMCPNQKEAVGYYDNCLLTYSNKTVFEAGGQILYNLLNASDVDGFNGAVRPLLNELRDNASAGGSLLKFASGNTTRPDSSTIYGLVQCTPDLSGEQCNECLDNAMNSFFISFGGSVGGRLLQPTCNFRYEIYRFFNGSTRVIPSPPSPPSPPPSSGLTPPVLSPPQGGKSSNRTTVIIVVVIVTISLIIIIASICIFLTLRKKKKQIPQTDHNETEAMDIGTVESLQYDFTLVKVATNDFSDENKLGKGGFGSVYKGKLEGGQEIAVKRLARDSGQGDVEFKNEVLLVAKLQHRNLVRLLGFSIEGNERLLIYEFLPNASLDQFIFDPTKGCTS